MQTTETGHLPQPRAAVRSVFGESEQSRHADEMLAFLEATPLSPDLDWTKDRDFLFHFEAARQIIVRNLLFAAGLRAYSQ
jgi:hypothetical protein